MWPVNLNAISDNAFKSDIPNDSSETQNTRNLQTSELTNVRTETPAQSNSCPVRIDSTSKSTNSPSAGITDDLHLPSTYNQVIPCKSNIIPSKVLPPKETLKQISPLPVITRSRSTRGRRASARELTYSDNISSLKLRVKRYKTPEGTTGKPVKVVSDSYCM